MVVLGSEFIKYVSDLAEKVGLLQMLHEFSYRNIIFCKYIQESWVIVFALGTSELSNFQ